MALADIQSTIEEPHSLDSLAYQHQEQELPQDLMTSSGPATLSSSSGTGRATPKW